MKRHVAVFRTWLSNEGQGKGIDSKWNTLWSRQNSTKFIKLS
ncbi:hypothetical protein [Anaerobacillus alkalidiazotrophicus]|nr:hypothetical protein [Anaerobacillus alkalidiazotrophicus]